MDDLDDRPPPRRPRTKWWRWNLVTLAVALFVLVWVRELSKWSYPATFLSASVVFLLWLVTPLGLEYEVTIKKVAAASRRKSLQKTITVKNMAASTIAIPTSIRIARIYAVLHIVVSALAFIMLNWLIFIRLNQNSRFVQGPSRRTFDFDQLILMFAGNGSTPLISVCFGFGLLMLTDIAITRRVELNWRMQQATTPPQIGE